MDFQTDLCSSVQAVRDLANGEVCRRGRKCERVSLYRAGEESGALHFRRADGQCQRLSSSVLLTAV